MLTAATYVKPAPIDKNRQLAMLSLTQQILDNSNTFINPAHKLVKGDSKKTLTKKRKTVSSSEFPANCLKWNASQINQKARKFNKAINKYSDKHKVDSHLIKAVITVESCFKTRALSGAGAQGLMQLIPATAERFGVKNSYNPEHNIAAGVKYLKFLLDRYKGNLKKAIAGYNAGEGKIDQYDGIPPYKETRQYVKNVLRIYQVLNPKLKSNKKRIYYPPSLSQKPGRQGWKYNRRLAPHLYKKIP